MTSPLQRFAIALRSLAVLGLAAWFIRSGEVRGQAGGQVRATVGARQTFSPAATNRGTGGSSFGGNQLGNGVPGFASGGARATRAAQQSASPNYYGGGPSIIYIDPSFALQSAANAGGVAAAPAAAVSLWPTAANTTAPTFVQSTSAGQSLGPAAGDAGGGPFVRPGLLAIAFDVQRAPSDQVGSAIAGRLSKMPSLHFVSAVRVDMVRGTAVLRGTVASDHDRELAGRVVLLEATVDHVVNMLVVRKPASPPPPIPAAPAPGVSARG